MYITLNIPGFLFYQFLDWRPPADPEEVIGLSLVAFIAEKDPAHAFLPAARLHDARYQPGSAVQTEVDRFGAPTWPRWRADAEFHNDMLYIARADTDLIKAAHTLHLIVREHYRGSSWQGEE